MPFSKEEFIKDITICENEFCNFREVNHVISMLKVNEESIDYEVIGRYIDEAIIDLEVPSRPLILVEPLKCQNCGVKLKHPFRMIGSSSNCDEIKLLKIIIPLLLCETCYRYQFHNSSPFFSVGFAILGDVFYSIHPYQRSNTEFSAPVNHHISDRHQKSSLLELRQSRHPLLPLERSEKAQRDSIGSSQPVKQRDLNVRRPLISKSLYTNNSSSESKNSRENILSSFSSTPHNVSSSNPYKSELLHLKIHTESSEQLTEFSSPKSNPLQVPSSIQSPTYNKNSQSSSVTGNRFTYDQALPIRDSLTSSSDLHTPTRRKLIPRISRSVNPPLSTSQLNSSSPTNTHLSTRDARSQSLSSPVEQSSAPVQKQEILNIRTRPSLPRSTHASSNMYLRSSSSSGINSVSLANDSPIPSNINLNTSRLSLGDNSIDTSNSQSPSNRVCKSTLVYVTPSPDIIKGTNRRELLIHPTSFSIVNFLSRQKDTFPFNSVRSTLVSKCGYRFSLGIYIDKIDSAIPSSTPDFYFVFDLYEKAKDMYETIKKFQS